MKDPTPINFSQRFQTGLLPRKYQEEPDYDVEDGQKSEAEEALSRRLDKLAVKVKAQQVIPKVV